MRNFWANLSGKLRIAIILLAGLILIFAVNKIYSYSDSKDKTIMVFETAPRKTVIEYDGKRVGSKHYSDRGKHSIKISMDGFESYEQDLEVKDKEPIIISVALTPRTDQASAIAKKEQARYLEIEAMTSREADKSEKQFAESYPIVKFLPYIKSYCRIDYGRDQTTGEFVVQISGGAMGRQVALEQIKLWGFKPGDYKIEFVGLVNPFDKNTKPLDPGDKDE